MMIQRALIMLKRSQIMRTEGNFDLFLVSRTESSQKSIINSGMHTFSNEFCCLERVNDS